MAQNDFELKNFSSLVAGEVSELLEEKGEGGFREAAFTQVAMDYLTGAQETGNTQVCTCVHRNAMGNRLRQLNGYALWDDYETLDLFISEFRGDGEVYTFEKAKSTSAFNQLSKYLAFAFKGNYNGLEESAEEQEFLQNFSHFRENLLRVRLILLTDGLVRGELKRAEQLPGNITLLYEVWDIERLYQIWTSQRKRGPIELNILEQFNYKVPVLSSSQSNNNYSACVAIVPGDLLADLYDQYGTRLLEQNVRVFLQNLGKVNQGIRKTIIGAPEMFLAYNNGISATATELELKPDPVTKQPLLGHIKGLQIVNGGQTTSSIYYARKKDRADLQNVQVQVKITVIPDSDQLERMVGNISKYANSQNKVSDVDLTSNQTFHILLEELSRTTWAAPTETSNQQTRWYYERVKGQYKEELNKEHTATRKLIFKRKNPADQIIRKEQLAKYFQTWNLSPHWVVRGSQKNYMNVMAELSSTEPDRTYFRDIIGNAILFRNAERLYGKKPNAMGDLRYLVVPYALAWLNYRTSSQIDLNRIWELQELSSPLNNLLRVVLLKVNDFFLNEKPDEYALVGEWAKKESCWDALKEKTPKDFGIDMTTIKRDLKSTRQKGESDLSISEMESRLRSVSADTWDLIEEFGIDTKRLDLYQIGLVRNLKRRIQQEKSLTEQMVEHGIQVLELWDRE